MILVCLTKGVPTRVECRTTGSVYGCGSNESGQLPCIVNAATPDVVTDAAGPSESSLQIPTPTKLLLPVNLISMTGSLERTVVFAYGHATGLFCPATSSKMPTIVTAYNGQDLLAM